MDFGNGEVDTSRDAVIGRWYAQGEKTLEEIGNAHGITRARVQQIIEKQGIKGRALMVARNAVKRQERLVKWETLVASDVQQAIAYFRGRGHHVTLQPPMRKGLSIKPDARQFWVNGIRTAVHGLSEPFRPVGIKHAGYHRVLTAGPGGHVVVTPHGVVELPSRPNRQFSYIRVDGKKSRACVRRETPVSVRREDVAEGSVLVDEVGEAG